MVMKDISAGVAHTLPMDLRKIFVSQSAVRMVWEDITPLARNEWICWIESAKKTETRERRIKILCDELVAGERRPCCWAGCGHR
jgi:uncharacterized protein YdeI (YjbR/CyaY-like superfamily)